MGNWDGRKARKSLDALRALLSEGVSGRGAGKGAGHMRAIWVQGTALRPQS
jgi:hypothetical protein